MEDVIAVSNEVPVIVDFGPNCVDRARRWAQR